MKKLKKEFWKYASKIEGATALEDAFTEWINEQNLSYKEANDLWNAVWEDAEEVMKIADDVTVNIAGRPEDIQKIVSNMPEATSVDIDQPEVTPAGMPEVPVEPKEEGTKTLIDTIEEPEETPETPEVPPGEGLPPLPV